MCCSEVEVQSVIGVPKIFQVTLKAIGQGHEQRLEKSDQIPAGPPERRTPKQKLDVIAGTSLTSQEHNYQR